MALKAKLTAEEYDESPDAVKGFYKKAADGGWVLDAEGVEDVRGLKSALEKEREGRKQLDAKLKELGEQYGDLDPEQAKAALEEVRKLQDKKLIDEGKIEELLQQRTEALRKEFKTKEAAYDKERQALTTERDKLKSAYEGVTIDHGLAAAATQAKVKPSAVTDLMLRGRHVWKLHEGRPTPFRDDGEILYGKDPKSPMSMEEWVATLQTEAPHLFEESKGAGSEPSAGRSNGGRITLSREQARDVRLWRQAEEQAARTGAQVVVTE